MAQCKTEVTPLLTWSFTLTHCGLAMPYMATWPWINIGLGHGLLPDGNKPLPEPMLTSHYWGLVAFTQEQFYIFKITAISPRGKWVKPSIGLCCWLSLVVVVECTAVSFVLDIKWWFHITIVSFQTLIIPQNVCCLHFHHHHHHNHHHLRLLYSL